MFKKISIGVLVDNKPLADYLKWAEISPGKRGGSFVSNGKIAPRELGEWGIILPKGGMIVPNSSPEELKEARRQLHEESRLLMENWDSLLLDGAKDYCEKIKEVSQKLGFQCRLVAQKCDTGSWDGYGTTILRRYIHLYEGDEHLLKIVTFSGEEGDVKGNFSFRDEGEIEEFLRREASLRRDPGVRDAATALIGKKAVLTANFPHRGTDPRPMVSTPKNSWIHAPTVLVKGDDTVFVTKNHTPQNAHWIVVGGGSWGVHTFSIEDVKLAETKIMEMFSVITPSGQLMVELEEVQRIFYPESLGDA
jgi:hypothetical protein